MRQLRPWLRQCHHNFSLVGLLLGLVCFVHHHHHWRYLSALLRPRQHERNNTREIRIAADRAEVKTNYYDYYCNHHHNYQQQEQQQQHKQQSSPVGVALAASVPPFRTTIRKRNSRIRHRTAQDAFPQEQQQQHEQQQQQLLPPPPQPPLPSQRLRRRNTPLIRRTESAQTQTTRRTTKTTTTTTTTLYSTLQQQLLVWVCRTSAILSGLGSLYILLIVLIASKRQQETQEQEQQRQEGTERRGLPRRIASSTFLLSFSQFPTAMEDPVWRGVLILLSLLTLVASCAWALASHAIIPQILPMSSLSSSSLETSSSSSSSLLFWGAEGTQASCRTQGFLIQFGLTGTYPKSCLFLWMLTTML